MQESNYFESLPKKRMGAGVLFFNENNELLLVKPTYKDHWSLVGGVVDENESPRQCCIREIKEELGLDINDLKFLCVHYYSPIPEKNEGLQFLFSGGKLSIEQISMIQLPTDELSEFKFFDCEKAITLVSEASGKCIIHGLSALENNTGLYYEV